MKKVAKKKETPEQKFQKLVDEKMEQLDRRYNDLIHNLITRCRTLLTDHENMANQCKEYLADQKTKESEHDFRERMHKEHIELYTSQFRQSFDQFQQVNDRGYQLSVKNNNALLKILEILSKK